MKLLAFAASHRPDSYNRMLIKIAQHYLETKNIQVDFAEYGEFDMPLYNDMMVEQSGVPESALAFAKRAASADGIIIASPEYNWSYPGTLKNIIDWTSRIIPSPVAGKTALLMSATPGSRGGIVGLQHLKTPLEALQLHPFHKVFPLGNCQSAFAGKLLADPKQTASLNATLDGYVTFTSRIANQE